MSTHAHKIALYICSEFHKYMVVGDRAVEVCGGSWYKIPGSRVLEGA